MERNPKDERLKSKNLLLDNQDEIDRAFKKAVNRARLENKRAGNTVAVWENDKVILIPPDEIVVEDI